MSENKKVLRLVSCFCGVEYCKPCRNSIKNPYSLLDPRTVETDGGSLIPCQIWQWDGGDAILGHYSSQMVEFDDGQGMRPWSAHHVVIRNGDRIEYSNKVANIQQALTLVGLSGEDFATEILYVDRDIATLIQLQNKLKNFPAEYQSSLLGLEDDQGDLGLGFQDLTTNVVEFMMRLNKHLENASTHKKGR